MVSRANSFVPVDLTTGVTGPLVVPGPNGGSFGAVQFSRSGKKLFFGWGLVLGGFGGVALHEAGTWQRLRVTSVPPVGIGQPSAMVMDEDGMSAFVGVSHVDPIARIYKLRGDTLEWTSTFAQPQSIHISELVWIPRSGQLVSSHGLGTSDGSVQLWRGRNLSSIMTLTNRESAALDLSLSQDGLSLAARFFDGVVVLWSTTDWSVLAERKIGTARDGSLTFTRRSRAIVVGGDDGSIVGLSAENLRELYSFPLDDAPTTGYEQFRRSKVERVRDGRRPAEQAARGERQSVRQRPGGDGKRARARAAAVGDRLRIAALVHRPVRRGRRGDHDRRIDDDRVSLRTRRANRVRRRDRES